ncbi:MAG: signal peptidase I [Bacilli bacterium]
MKKKNMSIIEKISNFLLNVLIIMFSIVLLVSIYNSIQIKIFKNDYSNFFGYSVFEVQTNSMADAINHDDWIIVKLTKNVKLNDIITYKEEKEFITHRIIEIYKGTYITMGDANNAKDDPVDQKQVIGKVVKVLRNFGTIRKTFFNKGVLIALIITLVLINFILRKKGNKEEPKETEETPKIDEVIKKIEIEKEEEKVEETKEPSNIIKVFKNLNTEEEIDKILLEKPLKEEPIPKNTDESLDVETKKNVITTEETSSIIATEDTPKINNFISVYNEEEKKDEEPNETLEEEKIDNKENEQTTIEINEEPKIINPENIITVDISDLEVLNKKTTVKPIIQIKEETTVKNIEIETTEIDEKQSKTLLNMINKKSKNKKSKNIIEKVIFIKTEEINEIIKAITKGTQTLTNELTIRSEFLKKYLDAKYYNIFDDLESEDEDKKTKMENLVLKFASKLIYSYKGKDKKYNLKVKKTEEIFMFIVNIEFSDNNDKIANYQNQIIKYSIEKNWDSYKIEEVINEIINIQNKYLNVIEYFLKNIETDKFKLKIIPIKNKKNMSALVLEHNIEFDRIYSELVIDETYNKGIIAEEKVAVTIDLLLIKFVKDMILSNFSNKYIVFIPKTLLPKKNKLQKILKLAIDNYAKENMILLLSYKGLLENKKNIKNLRKMGYHFALTINSLEELKPHEIGNLYVADYLFTGTLNKKEILKNVPEDYKDNIIDENILHLLNEDIESRE